LAAVGDADVVEQQFRRLAEASGAELHAAIRVLAWNEDARENLYPFLEDFDEALRRTTYTALIERGDDTAIRRAQFERSEFTRKMAVYALAKRSETTFMVRKFLNDSHPSVRRAAISALELQQESREVLRHLVADPDPDVRLEAIRVLTGDAESAGAIRERLEDEDSRVRLAARFSLLRNDDGSRQFEPSEPE
jgi:HEAT repeat protein